MKLRQVCAAAAVFGGTGAACATGNVAVVCNFSAAGAGVSQNPFVHGVVAVETTGVPGEYDNSVCGIMFGLRPCKTYDVRIVNGDESFGVGVGDVFTTNFFGFAFFSMTFEDTPGSLAENPTVDVFIDEDAELLDISPSEARASGTGCG